MEDPDTVDPCDIQGLADIELSDRIASWTFPFEYQQVAIDDAPGSSTKRAYANRRDFFTLSHFKHLFGLSFWPVTTR